MPPWGWLQELPLATPTLTVLPPCLLSAFFRGTYFAHDDLFRVIEAAAPLVRCTIGHGVS